MTSGPRAAGPRAACPRLALALLLALGSATGLPPARAATGSGPKRRTGSLVRIGQRHGVTVYQRPGGAVIELMAEGELPGTPDEVQRRLVDYARHPELLPSLAESRVLEQGRGRLLVYQRLDLPFISDRDFTLEVSWDRRGEERWVRFQNTLSRGPPPRPGVVRVPLHEGSWELRPIGDRSGPPRTWARYRFRLDLGGSLPRWLGRARAGRDVPALFQRLRAQLRRGARGPR